MTDRTIRKRSDQCVLLDWGDCVMKVFEECQGAMEYWPRVEAVPGVAEAIEHLRPFSLVCLATNAADSGEKSIRRALARVGLDEVFDRVFCYEVVGYRKPSQEFFNTVLKQLALGPDTVYMVGDQFDTDVLGANAVGIRAVWLNEVDEDDRVGDTYRTVWAHEGTVAALESLGLATGF